jgi:hypothetical protein
MLFSFLSVIYRRTVLSLGVNHDIYDHVHLIVKGRYKTGGTGQLYDGFPDCEWKMNTP